MVSDGESPLPLQTAASKLITPKPNWYPFKARQWVAFGSSLGHFLVAFVHIASSVPQEVC